MLSVDAASVKLNARAATTNASIDLKGGMRVIVMHYAPLAPLAGDLNLRNGLRLAEVCVWNWTGNGRRRRHAGCQLIRYEEKWIAT
jgi:hypothetical protein